MQEQMKQSLIKMFAISAKARFLHAPKVTKLGQISSVHYVSILGTETARR